MRTFTQKEIKTLFNKARRVVKHTGFVILKSPKMADVAGLLVVTPRKIGNAPKRNRVRRRLRAIFYEENLFQGLYDCVVIVKKEGVEIPFDEWKAVLTQALSPDQ